MQQPNTGLRLVLCLLLSVASAWSFGCGGGSGGTTTGGSGTGGTGSGTGTGSSNPGPVLVVVEENHGFNSVIGNSSMPYLNQLANQYALATLYYANTHPSMNNYFEMTAGDSKIAPGPDPDTYDGPANADNIVRHLLAAGKTWKSYAEGLPSVGYVRGDTGTYVHHHNPLSYFTDVLNAPAQSNNLVPFTQFAIDLSAGQLPNFSFVVPNNDNNAHDGSLSAADAWLKANIAPILTNPQFQNNGLLFIVFDEAETTDTLHGGGQVAMVAIGPKVKSSFKSTILYQHQNLLKTITTYIGIDGNIGDAGAASAMSDLLK